MKDLKEKIEYIMENPVTIDATKEKVIEDTLKKINDL